MRTGILAVSALLCLLEYLEAGSVHGKVDQVLWVNPGRVEIKDLAAGPGGTGLRPVPPFHLVKEENSGSSPKIRVRDRRGVEWSAKFGPEVHSETFATRLVWAVGYIAEPEYFVSKGRITGVHDLTRAAHVIGKDGAFSEARFQLRSQKAIFSKRYNWSWVNNPFQGTKELNGLKIMIMLTSDWDDKDARDVDRDANTSVFETYTRHHARYLYFIPDWGGSMGKWGNVVTRSKWDCKGYRSQNEEFLRGIKNGFVEWGYSGQHTADMTRGLRVEDVQWLMQYLGRITDRQIVAALRAAGASLDEEACFSAAVRDRIERLRDVAHDPSRWTHR